MTPARPRIVEVAPLRADRYPALFEPPASLPEAEQRLLDATDIVVGINLQLAAADKAAPGYSAWRSKALFAQRFALREQREVRAWIAAHKAAHVTTGTSKESAWLLAVRAAHVLEQLAAAGVDIGAAGRAVIADTDREVPAKYRARAAEVPQ